MKQTNLLARTTRVVGLAVLLVSSTSPEALALGPVFPITGSCEQLDTCPDGTIVIIDTTNTPIPELNANFRELRDATISLNATNQTPFYGVASVAGPGTRFYFCNPDIAMGTNGGIAVFVEKVVVTYGEPDEFLIRKVMLDAIGHPVTNETTVAGVESSGVDPVARVGMNRQGRSAVVFFDQLPTTDHFAKAQLFDETGNPVAAPLTLNESPRPQDGLMAAWSPSVAVAPSGTCMFVWDETYQGKYSTLPGTNIFLRLVTPAGTPASGQTQINGAAAATRSDPEVAAGPAGQFVVVWSQESSSRNGIYMRRYAADGTPLESERRVSPATGSSPEVAISSNGSFIVVWQGPDGDGNGIFAQRFETNGTPVGLPLLINEESRPGSQSKPLVGLSDSGDAMVAWTSQGTRGARWFAWSATNAEPAYGPHVLSFTPMLETGNVKSLLIEFDRPIDPATLTVDDIALTDPRGNTSSPVTSIQTTNNTLFSVALSGMSLPGQYGLRVGPSILDTFGVAMDQNLNTVKGEATDAYSNTFILPPTTTTATPVAEGFEAGSASLSSWSFNFNPALGDNIGVQAGEARTGTHCLAFFNQGGVLPPAGKTICALWAVDLSALTNTDTRLSFWLRAPSWDNNGPISVQIGSDLQTWSTLLTFYFEQASPYTYHGIDLDAGIRAAGLNAAQPLYLRFLHTIPYSPYNQAAAAFLIDDIQIAVDPLPLRLLSSANGSFRLVWPWPSAGWVCQTNTDLLSPNWGDLPQPPVADATNCYIEVPPPGNPLFYRLIWR